MADRVYLVTATTTTQWRWGLLYLVFREWEDQRSFYGHYQPAEINMGQTRETSRPSDVSRETTTKHTTADHSAVYWESHHRPMQGESTTHNVHGDQEQPTDVCLQRDTQAATTQWLPISTRHIKFYTSHPPQTDMLDAINNAVEEDILADIHSTPLLGLIIDETTDVSIYKKLCIYVKCLRNNHPIIHFLDCVSVPDGRAETIVNAIEQTLARYEIPPTKIHSLATDGASVMMGKRGGVGAPLRERHNPGLIQIHCITHRVALAAGQACRDVTYFNEYQLILKQLFQVLQQLSRPLQPATSTARPTRRRQHTHPVPEEASIIPMVVTGRSSQRNIQLLPSHLRNPGEPSCQQGCSWCQGSATEAEVCRLPAYHCFPGRCTRLCQQTEPGVPARPDRRISHQRHGHLHYWAPHLLQPARWHYSHQGLQLHRQLKLPRRHPHRQADPEDAVPEFSYSVHRQPDHQPPAAIRPRLNGHTSATQRDPQPSQHAWRPQHPNLRWRHPQRTDRQPITTNHYCRSTEGLRWPEAATPPEEVTHTTADLPRPPTQPCRPVPDLRTTIRPPDDFASD